MKTPFARALFSLPSVFRSPLVILALMVAVPWAGWSFTVGNITFNTTTDAFNTGVVISPAVINHYGFTWTSASTNQAQVNSPTLNRVLLVTSSGSTPTFVGFKSDDGTAFKLNNFGYTAATSNYSSPANVTLRGYKGGVAVSGAVDVKQPTNNTGSTPDTWDVSAISGFGNIDEVRITTDVSNTFGSFRIYSISTSTAVSPTTTITSLNRASTNPSNASTVNYTLTFASAVTGVTASNFSLSGAAATGASVGTPTTANGGLTWNVPVTTGSTDGTLTLSVGNATGFTPGVSTALPFTTAGQSYTMDKTLPTVSVGAPSSAIVGTGSTVTYLVTYTDANFSSSTLSTAGITLNATGGASGTVTVTGTGNTRTVTISSITGTGTLGITVAAATATDTAGNTNLASGASSTVSVITANVIDFETALSGGWTLSSPMILNSGATGYGSATYGASAPTSSGYLDANFNTVSAVGTNVGGIKAPTGFTFRALSFDIWPSANQGGDIIPYGTNGLGLGTNLTAETGHDFIVKGYLNGNVVVNVTVKEKQRSPVQTTCTGGLWSFLDLSGTAFPTTNIDKIDITLASQSGNATDGPRAGQPLSTPNYIALDNFVYTALTATSPTVTVPGGTTTLTTTTSGTPGTSVSFNITGANLTGAPGNLTVTAPANVQVSADNSTWGGTASIPFSSATLASTPVYVRLAGTGSVGTISGNVSITGGGLASAVTQAVSGTLNPAPSPTVTNVTSLTANGAYRATQSVSIQVTFNASVTVTGTPTLALNSGGTASYASGSPGTTLTFNYTVGATQNSLDLDYSATTSLALAGGTINATTGGTAATLTLPTPGAAGSLGANKNIVIDTTAPTILSINRQTPSGQITALNSMTFRVTYSEAVSGMTTSSFAVIPANGSNIVGTVTGVNVVNPTTCDVSVSITSGTGDFRLRGVN